ncbi:MAG: SIMPL domain-containing protein [Patescibacteria group bacterium]|nr:SIMPL domain-containing protein [Patescibacteria group bacterium]
MDLEKYYYGRLIRVGSLTLLVLAVFLAARTVNEFKRYHTIGTDAPVNNTISVSGEGEAFAVPDVATFTFSVTEEALVVAEAQQLTSTKVDGALEFLREQGVEERDIKTVSYNIYPRYEFARIVCITYPCAEGKRELAGYEVSQTIEVKIRSLAGAGTLLGGLGEIGVTNVSGLAFSVDDEEVVQREAREKAIQQAKEKGKQLAKDLGVRLVRIVSFNESGGPIYFRSYAVEAFGKGGADAAPIPEVPAGENRIVSNVTITYEIR